MKPKFRLRGIRQHINFPMDISSYSLKEAKEYIRSLARMRFNAITFHSYPGQWHETNPDDPENTAGHFFYGQVHPVPRENRRISSLIENRSVYCIPEAEAVFDDPAKRADYAKYWLNEVMKTAKEAYMEITLSVEIRSDDTVAETKMLRALLKTYPLIDTLELITEENGGTGEPAVSLTRVLSALEKREDWLDGLFRQPGLRAGLYLTDRETLRAVLPVLRESLPAGVTMSLLPAHGALAVADNLESIGFLPEEWQNTMIYSWAEFDGNMFIQQMSTDGIEKLCSMPPTASSYGFCINHWRTAENRLTIAYASEAGIDSMPADAYYRRYAKRTGISDADGFAALCMGLAKLDTYNRDHLFNIGFCAVVCWLNWHRKGNYMLPRGFAEECYDHALKEYAALSEKACVLIPSSRTREGTAFLRLLDNRCRASILHIRSMKTLEELNEVFDFEHPVTLSPEQRRKINTILKRSRDDAEAYMELYAEILPDRGDEGLIVSYHETVPVYIDAVAAPFSGGGVCPGQEAYGSPPMPNDS